MPKTTHIFLSNQAVVARLTVQAAREQRSKTAIVYRALERYFAATDIEAKVREVNAAS